MKERTVGIMELVRMEEQGARKVLARRGVVNPTDEEVAGLTDRMYPAPPMNLSSLPDVQTIRVMKRKRFRYYHPKPSRLKG